MKVRSNLYWNLLYSHPRLWNSEDNHLLFLISMIYIFFLFFLCQISCLIFQILHFRPLNILLTIGYHLFASKKLSHPIEPTIFLLSFKRDNHLFLVLLYLNLLKFDFYFVIYTGSGILSKEHHLSLNYLNILKTWTIFQLHCLSQKNLILIKYFKIIQKL